jgi:hypothetical protein
MDALSILAVAVDSSCAGRAGEKAAPRIALAEQKQLTAALAGGRPCERTGVFVIVKVLHQHVMVDGTS